MDRAEQFAQAGAVPGRNAHLFRPFDEGQLAPEQRLDLTAALAAYTAGSAHVNHLDDTGVIHPGYLAWVLEGLVAGEVTNRIEVPETVAADARLALQRMLDAKPKS